MYVMLDIMLCVNPLPAHKRFLISRIYWLCISKYSIHFFKALSSVVRSALGAHRVGTKFLLLGNNLRS